MTACLFALIGFGTPRVSATASRWKTNRSSTIPGLYGLIPKSAVALESVLGDYFDIPVEVEPFVGTWRGLAEPDHCTFGGDVPESTMLGFGAVVGRRGLGPGSRAFG